MADIPRPEYPRPDFQRNEWINLNGEWDFSFDKPVFDKRIIVPFCYQSQMSGINDKAIHNEVWYRHAFSINEDKLKIGRILLHFGAVDYLTRLWVNEALVGEHKGGHCSFFFDITDYVKAGENIIVVKAEDYPETDKPRGKQTWTGKEFGCWYTPTTGIWQSVWIEFAGSVYVKKVKITPDTQNLTAICEIFLSSYDEINVELTAELNPWDYLRNAPDGNSFADNINLGKAVAVCSNGYGKAVFSFKDMDCRERLLWSPERPNLIDIKVTVKSTLEDTVKTYFGMRSIEIIKDKIALNSNLCYQRLVLDQGYWPESLLTPPSDEAIKKDILLTKEMGFNGARKHQKIEDPRYYYWADRLGLMVWGELPSAYEFNDNAIENTTRELIEFVSRDFNHPCIVAWVPVNESWGVRAAGRNKQQQDYVRALLYIIKALDKTRFISANDGWEQPSETDICAIHDYSLKPDSVPKYDNFQKILDSAAESRFLFAQDNGYRGQPVIMTEYGGIAFDNGQAGWGYHEKAADEKGFLERLEPVTAFLIRSGKFEGFCYTQLTDVMQEVNGLLTENRQPKIQKDKLRRIFGMSLH